MALVLLNPTSLVAGALIYGGTSFAAALAAVQFAPSNFLEVGGLLFTGVAVGVFLSVLVHPVIGSRERNLWPFEVVIFGGVGLVPMWLGLVLGRFLHARKTST